MPTSTASAVWNGSIGEGSGTMTMANYEGPYSAPSRFQGAEGSTPEELLAAAHAGCFSMQLSALLTRGGHTPDRIETSADVKIEKLEDGWAITSVHLTTNAAVPGIDEATFLEFADKAKATCPVSKLYAGGSAEITMDATLA
ncbi:MAG TPA: OsmC family peroxiredoxin [Acidimicrobiia bacterium]|jgi:osmotically inducible protein OsmC